MKNRGLAGGFNFDQPKKSQALIPTESSVLASIQDHCRWNRIYFQRTNSGKVQVGKHWIKLCDEGTPDLLICYRGLFLGCETKRLNETARETQITEHVKITKAGGFVIVAHSRDEFCAGLKEIDNLLNNLIWMLFGIVNR
jgi:hypothetical protein